MSNQEGKPVQPWEFWEENCGVNSTIGYGIITNDRDVSVTVHARRPKGDGYSEVDCSEVAKLTGQQIVTAYNATYGAGIDPAGIESAREILETLSRYVTASVYPDGPCIDHHDMADIHNALAALNLNKGAVTP